MCSLFLNSNWLGMVTAWHVVAVFSNQRLMCSPQLGMHLTKLGEILLKLLPCLLQWEQYTLLICFCWAHESSGWVKRTLEVSGGCLLSYTGPSQKFTEARETKKIFFFGGGGFAKPHVRTPMMFCTPTGLTVEAWNANFRLLEVGGGGEGRFREKLILFISFLRTFEIAQRNVKLNNPLSPQATWLVPFSVQPDSYLSRSNLTRTFLSPTWLVPFSVQPDSYLSRSNLTRTFLGPTWLVPFSVHFTLKITGHPSIILRPKQHIYIILIPPLATLPAFLCSLCICLRRVRSSFCCSSKTPFSSVSRRFCSSISFLKISQEK